MCPRVRGVYRARIGGSVLAGGTGALATIYGGLPPGGGIVNLGRLAKVSYPGYTSGHADTIEFTSYAHAVNVPIRLDGKHAPALGGLGFSNPHTIAG